jgi:hypothetical protein
VLLLHRAAAAVAALGVVEETMSEFPQNRRFSVAEEVAAAARRFCLRKEAHEEEMHVVDVGPRADAHARSTIALLMRVIMKFCLSRMSRMCRTQIRKKTQKYELIDREKKTNF